MEQEEIEIKIESSSEPTKPQQKTTIKKKNLKCTEVQKSPLEKNGEMCSVLHEGKTTITSNFEYSCSKNGEKKMYSSRRIVKHHIERDIKKKKDFVTIEYSKKIEDLNYKEGLEIVRNISCGLKLFHNSLKRGDLVGLYLDTCKEWMLSAQALYMNSLVSVTCYANLGKDALVAVVNECELELLIMSADQVKFADNYLADRCPTLKKIITVGDSKYKSKKFEVKNLYDILIDGEKNRSTQSFEKPKPEDTAIIMYTSGTTGVPKGVIITHANVVATCAAFVAHIKFTSDDVHLSYLYVFFNLLIFFRPLAHSFEYVAHICFLFVGGHVCFGNPRTLIAKPGGAKKKGDLEAYKPTIFIGVPRVWETIKKAVAIKIRNASFLKKYLFFRVYSKKVGLLKKGKNKKVLLEDLVFKKIRAFLGGKARLVASGGAPLSPEANYFLQAALGTNVIVVQGYGLTETTIAACIQDPNKWTGVGKVGPPIPSIRIKLEDIPEMNYLTTNKPPEGEILIRGNSISKGYYKKPVETKEVYDEDGWFHTGDVGRLNKDGSFSIIDRKKLSQGEYIAVENLEMIYGTSPFCLPNGLCISPNSLKPFICAIVLADPVFAKQWGKERNLKSNFEDIIKNNKFKQELLQSLAGIGKKYKKKSWEIIKDIRIFSHTWTPENGILTSSMKIKRREIREKYKVALNEMYEPESKKSIVVQKKRDDGIKVPQFYEVLNENAL